MQLRQAFGPRGPRRYSAFKYVAENGYLPKDWDWAASTLNVHLPPLPYLVSSSMDGICDLVTGDAPPPRRTAPCGNHAETLLNVTSNLPASVDRATVREEIRAPPATPQPPPPGARLFGYRECSDDGCPV